MCTELAEFGDSITCPSPMYMATWLIARDGGSVAKNTRSPGRSALG